MRTTISCRGPLLWAIACCAWLASSGCTLPQGDPSTAPGSTEAPDASADVTTFDGTTPDATVDGDAEPARADQSASEPLAEADEPPQPPELSLLALIDASPGCTDGGSPLVPTADGGTTCAGQLAQSVFQRALCSCGWIQVSGPLTTDGFNSTKGPPDGGLGGSVASNGTEAWSSKVSIGGDLVTPGSLQSSSSSTIRGDLHLGGAVVASGPLTVDGNAYVVETLPKKDVTVDGTTTHVASVAPACDCADLLPIATIVADRRPPNDDDTVIGLSPYAAIAVTPTHIDLPCGSYYFAEIAVSAPLTIAVHGHTALYVGGDVLASAPVVFAIDPTATLDLFVAGSVDVASTLTLGSPSNPAQCRAYVGGLSLGMTGASVLGCNVYAPSAAFESSATTTIYGSLFVGGFTAGASTTIHYDEAIQNAGAQCGAPASCDDGNPCTTDSSSSNGTCTHTPVANGATCSGTSLCEQAYSCQAGACVGSDPVVCTASDACHVAGTCNPSTGQCSVATAPNGTACSDGNACTQSDSCQSGTCTGASPVTCTASDSCHAAGTCDPTSGACSNPTAANGTTCNDGNACTQTDACENGTCTGTNPVTCTASDQCHAAGSCSPSTGQCSNPTAANGTTCNDGNACTQTDACENGTCTGTNPVTCTASDSCHVAGACDPTSGGCSNPTAPNGTSCSDGNACTQVDACQNGTCTGSDPVTCTASDACHLAGTCDSTTGSCSSPAAADGTSCNDGNACTQTDACTAGTCTGSNPVTCTASDSCHAAGTCDPTSGSCSNPAAADGTTCDDGNSCTQTDVCTAGACTGSNPVSCPGLPPPWSAIASMSTARTQHAATELATGDVLVTGGSPDSTSDTSLAVAEIYGSASGAWTPVAPMNVARWGHTATLLANGQVLVAGGTSNGTDVASAETYDPTSGTWTPAASMSAARVNNQAVLLASGRVLVVGVGNGVGPSSEIYDPVANTWSSVTGAVAGGGQSGVVVLLADGRVLAAGGATSDPTVPASAASIYDPKSNAWTAVAAMPEARMAGVGALLPSGNVLVAGGTGAPPQGQTQGPALADSFVFDPLTNVWTAAGSMSVARVSPAIATLPNGTVLVAGGQASGGDTYAPNAGGWSAATSATTLSGATATSTASGSILVAGGVDSNGNALPTAQLFSAPDAACTLTSTCNPTSGQCSGSFQPDGTACSDGNACTQADACKSGYCVGTSPVSCTGSTSCQASECNASTGKCAGVNAGNGTSCSDSNACTQGDSCQNGACAGSPVTCAASDSCHVAGACNPTTGTCSNPAAPNGTACSDGDACTQTDSCQAGTCTGSNPVTCTASDSCHVAGTCNPSSGTCSNPAASNGTSCSDGNACTQGDSCQSGTCAGGSPVVCAASDSCHVAGTCNPSSGTCSNPAAANGTSCSDGNACTQGDSCQSGTCASGSPVFCSASDQCHVAGVCNASTGSCSNPAAANGTTCTDGNACTQTDACENGACTGSNPVTCTASDECHIVGACNPGTGTCSNPAVADGTLCNDGNACTLVSGCVSGTCVGTTPVTCTATDACHLSGVCDPTTGSCTNPVAADGGGCDDGNPCTVDSCGGPGGACLHTPVAVGTACGDNSNQCIGALTCNAQAACVQGSAPRPNPPNRCYSWSCDPSSGFSYTPIAGCDPSPITQGGAFEPNASILGVVSLASGGPLTGYTVTVTDAPCSGPPRTDVSVTIAGDGSFRARLTDFPTSEPLRTPAHHECLQIASASTLTVYRNVYLHPGDARDLGPITAVTRDPQMTMIGASGGTAKDSQGLFQVVVPPGALTAPTPIVITPLKTRDALPLTLPRQTNTTYAVALEPEGTQFATPVTVRVSNWLNLPTSLQIPVAYQDQTNLVWLDLATATWDGQMFSYKTPHFSNDDINTNAANALLLIASVGRDPSQSQGQCGVGSSMGLADGTLRQSFPLPTYKRDGRDYGVTLTYDSLLTFGETSSPSSQTSYGSVSPTGVITSVRGTTAGMMCVPRASADGILASTPGSCLAGSCGGGVAFNGALGSLAWKWDIQGGTGGTAPATAPNGALDLELIPSVTLSSPTGSPGTLPANGFAAHHVELQGSGGSACVGGGSFGVESGTPVLAPQDTGPLVYLDTNAFVYQRHASPYGAGWGLDGVDELFTDPTAESAVLVHGNGDQEYFSPRANTTYLTTWESNSGLARDPVSGTIYGADSAGNIYQVNPATGALTGVLGGLGWSTPALTMAVTYVGGDQHFVVVLTGSVVDVDATSHSQRALAFATPHVETPNYWGFIPAVTASGSLVFYAPGDPNNPILQSADLSQASPTIVNLSVATGGQTGLQPTGTVSQFTFGDPHGLDYIAGQGLYVADRKRNTIYLVEPDPNGGGLVDPGSTIIRAAGSGASMTVTPIGYRIVAADADISQPSALMDDGNGNLWVITPFGAGIFDVLSNDFRFEILDARVPNSELPYQLFQGGLSSFAVLGTTPTLLAHIGSDFIRIDVTPYSSERDPTRTLVVGATGSTLTDTTADITEAFNPAGLMLEKSLGTGEPLYSVGYVSGTDTVQSITDPTGSSVILAYDGNGKLASITDPVHPPTVVTVNDSGDLASFQEPDGETYAFVYAAHRMSSKTSPDKDITGYAYSADGSLSSTSKPAPGDSYTNILPAYSQPSQRDANGNTIRVGSYTDPRGVTHTLTIDKHGNVSSDAYAADGVSYTRAYELATTLGRTDEGLYYERGNVNLGRVTAWTLNGLEATLPHQYDTLGRLTTVTQQFNTSSASETFAYDANGRLSSYYQPPGSDSFSIARDAAGHLLSITESNGRQLAFTWNGPDGQSDTVTEHKVTTNVVFDGQGNPSSFSDSIGRLWVTARDVAGNVTTSSDSVASWTYGYDANNRLTAATDGAGNTTTYSYVQTGCGCSQADLVTSIATPDLPPPLAWALSWGPEGRLSTLTDPDGNAESYTYEPTGELKSVTDRDGHTTSTTHDQLGRPKAVTDALGRLHPLVYPVPTATQWTGSQLLAGSADSSTPATDLTSVLRDGDYEIGEGTYDTEKVTAGTMSRGVAQISFYRDATTQISYGITRDVGLRVTNVYDRSGLPFSGSEVYDPNNVLSGTLVAPQYTYTPSLPIPLKTNDAENYNGGTPGGTLNYGSAYDPFDLVSSSGFGGGLSPPGKYFYSVDTAGRRTGTTRQYAYASPGPSSAVTYHPTSDRVIEDDLVSLAKPADPTETRSIVYNAQGLVQTIKAPEGTYGFDGYDGLGRNTHLTYPDGHTRAQQFDHEGRITQRCYEYTNGAANRCYGASYDAAGNVTQLTDPEGTDVVAVDGLYRLQSVTRTGTTSETETYAYNALGALNSNAPAATGVELDDQRPIVGGTGTAGSAVMNTADGLPVTVDAAGRLTSLEGATLQFDKEGLLWSIASGGNTESFVYDEDFRVTSRLHNGASVETYVYDGPNVAALLAPNGRFTMTWLYDGVDSPLRVTQPQVTGAPVTYYELDLAGNVRRLRAAGGGDGGGYRYSAFGVSYNDPGTPAPTLAQPLQWKGRWAFDLAGGVYNVRARWWSPRTAAFLSIDGLVNHTPTSSLWAWPGQNPITLRDPTGEKAYSEPETVQIMLGYQETLESATGLHWGLMAENHSASGPMDYALTQPDDTFDVPNVGTLNAAEFGNFMAGYAAGSMGDVGAFALVHAAGSMYGIVKPDAVWYLLGDDRHGFDYINTGWWYGIDVLINENLGRPAISSGRCLAPTGQDDAVAAGP